ncbi:unnamed protein product [Periconia digitata]|uniref:SGNH hydrolase-type esterase domain-containing protein n=1 Tax=Periconia digitata TaxID=1303443 RepID=A0A9W4UAA8_9PLEO|nr:unnamed protein product [Periconia digitata]
MCGLPTPRVLEAIMDRRSSSHKLPVFVLFGDSLTQWSFDEKTEGPGWYLGCTYRDKVEIENEGYAGYTSSSVQRDFDRLIARITRPDAPPTLLITIFLGANDACLIGNSEYVPLPSFEANIRGFVDAILAQDALRETKIVLITPPPINVPDPVDDSDTDYEDLGPSMAAALAAARPDPKDDRAYRTYMSKKCYADAILRIAREYEGADDSATAERVAGLDYWKALVDAALEDQGRNSSDEDAYDEEKLPGCGLATAKEFEKGYFTDGLHLEKRGYAVLNRVLMDVVTKKWPGLSALRS